MSETHAPFWIYGSGMVKLEFARSLLHPSFTVDERSERRATFRLKGNRWHVITVDVPNLEPGPDGKKVGLNLLSIRRS